MLNLITQANNIWAIYHQQETYNSKLVGWKVLLLRKLRKYLSEYKLKQHKYGLTKEDEKQLIESINYELNQDSLKMKRFLKEHLIITYKKSWKEAEKNIQEAEQQPSDDEIEKIVTKVWVGNKNFQQRQDVNTDKISDRLKKIFLDPHLSLEQKQAEMEKEMTSFYNMNHRLMRTETIHIINEANVDCMKKSGIYQVMWVTADDERVCPVCNSRDRHIYSIDMIPNYPDHPNCRCVLIGYKKFDENKIDNL